MNVYRWSEYLQNAKIFVDILNRKMLNNDLPIAYQNLMLNWWF